MIHLAQMASIAVLAAGAVAPSAAYGATDMSGVWIVTAYSPQIRTTAGAEPPMLPAAARLYQERKALAKRGDYSFDPVAQRCAAPGFPRVMMMPYAFEIAQDPDRVVFMFEWDRLYRRVNVNAPSRSADDLQFTGRSSAHWEGDTLVVDVQQVDETFIDAAGMPHSSALKATERWRLLPTGLLENRIRFDDPQTFEKPWETTITYRRMPANYELQENICLDRISTTPAIQERNHDTYRR